MGISVFPAAGGGVTQKVSEFTSTGTFTVPSNCSAVSLILVGAGGGGGAAKSTNTSVISSGGGGGGEVWEGTISVTPGASYTVTIGAGGAGSSNIASAGGNGGATTFGALATANGGGGGAGIPNDYLGFTGPTRNGGYGGGDSQISSGAGGGAGGHAIQYATGGSATNPPFTAPGAITDLPSTRLGGAGSFSGTGTGVNALPNYAGLAKYGFGAGGAGGTHYWTNFGGNASGMSITTGSSRPGVWVRNIDAFVAGSNANANTGDGGSGTVRHGGAGTNTGLNGGSGYARVIYWS